ncbi:sulfide:quinone oxidoreductase, mitochondrial-like [Lytechinus variegatus]|uniref:sulfide:quinone oxidoreductase, mitochondrial-like n=1 Tax=Lytechinus variegatus TaxID=7654 RepID=UPI001BB1F27B|nr:sulfide:quinone oxidoreductase, mitochondrial-like [Lytechinus variegatus]XP_041458253.1 sulfide:quinone oxidoreductase, mitochondrial-like [Lytechinus variegatus]XP_041458254.1 sulfide:quinone oxidoreductase, mitochondrial-like [Lytechinus variegatus]XP_041458255.1 sulfide:quinone oxidoreductase, mitochondrial-like [Lytechinus variegatus]
MAFCMKESLNSIAVIGRQIRTLNSTSSFKTKLWYSTAAKPVHEPQEGPGPVTKQSYKFVVVGGGTGGLAAASFLSRKFGQGHVAVIEPAEQHFYQPMWTMVGGGIKTKEQSMRPMASVMPKKVDWKKDKAVTFDPENNLVTTSSGINLEYEYLVVAMGLQLNFHAMKGLTEALAEDPMVCCNYSYDTVDKTYKALQNFKGGNAIFTFPSTPVKCAGAPQKVMYLTEDYFRKNGKRDQAEVMYITPQAVIFGPPKYAECLRKVCDKRGIKVHYKHKLVEIRHDKREADFELESGEIVTFPYAMIHVPPPMGPPDVLKASPLVDQTGFLTVNKTTCQHTKYPNIFGLGDCTDIPTSKTAAAVAAQTGTLKKTLSSVMNGHKPQASYDGYSSCPLVTGYGKLILAEFDFNLDALETFPLDQGKERRLMYHLKKDIMPELYWNGLIKGLWNGPGAYRKLMHLGMSK